jgi:YegS/Rv2252/BmrU family lipid kinase
MPAAKHESPAAICSEGSFGCIVAKCGPSDSVHEMRSAVLISNARAGTSDRDSVRAVVERLETAGVGVEVIATESAADLDAALDRRGARDVIVAGGDGSLHAVVAALVRRGELDQPTVGLVPLGTGNDFARSLDIPFDPAAAARVCVEGESRSLDILVDSAGGIVVNAVNLGIGAEASRRAKPWKSTLGRAAYAVGALAAGLTAKGLPLTIETDGEIVADGSEPVLQVGIANGRFVGGGTALAPRARASDGQVDVIVSFAAGPIRRFGYAAQVKLRRHLERRDVRLVRATSVRVSGAEYWVSADGELSGPISDRAWSVLPGALKLTVPPAAES